MQTPRRALRCEFCNQVIDDDYYGPCPHCGGNLALASQVWVTENGIERAWCSCDNTRYYVDGGITSRPVPVPALLYMNDGQPIEFYAAYGAAADTDEPAYADEGEEDMVDDMPSGPDRPMHPTEEEIFRMHGPQPENKRWGGILGWLLGE